MQVTYMWNGGSWLLGKESMWPWSKSPFIKGTSCKHKHGHYGHLSPMRGPKPPRLCLWLASPYPQRPTFAHSITLITSRPTTDISGWEGQSMLHPLGVHKYMEEENRIPWQRTHSANSFAIGNQHDILSTLKLALGGMGDAKGCPIGEVQISSKK